MNNNYNEIKLCVDKECPFWLWRFKRVKSKPPLKAIRAKCKECGEGTAQDIKNYEIVDCWIYPFRCGKNPYTKNKGNPNNLKPFPRKDSHFSTQNFPKKGIVADITTPKT